MNDFELEIEKKNQLMQVAAGKMEFTTKVRQNRKSEKEN